MGMTVLQLQQQSAGARSEALVDKKKKRRSNRRPKHNGPISLEVSDCFQNGSVNLESRSCPTPLPFQDHFIPLYGCNNQKYFDPFWSLDVLAEALQRGEVFQAVLRVNAHNRLEAYCTIEGVTTDIFIGGIPRQNRAVEGDVVAVKVDPLQLWSRMKGLSSNHSSPMDDRDPSVATEISHNSKGKSAVDVESVTNCSPLEENGYGISYSYVNGHHYSQADPLGEGSPCGENEILNSIEKLCHVVVSFASKRPTGKVVAIIEPSPHREAIVGFLNAEWLLMARRSSEKRVERLQLSCLLPVLIAYS